MTEQEARWFEELHEIRARGAEIDKQPWRGGYQEMMSGLYPDTAHFILELLQNANDAKATKVHFGLKADGLLVYHNGLRGFSLSDPKRENEDRARGCLGDINSITSIGRSTKSVGSQATEVSIGKFGIGFKSVFEYTCSPEIYDRHFRFRLQDWYVPSLIESDLTGREIGDTAFWLPFDRADKPDRTPERCYDDIAAKLKTLVNPTLFLPYLQSVSFEVDGMIGSHSKRVENSRTVGDITAECITCIHRFCDTEETESLALFTRRSNTQHDICVGFGMNSNGLRPLKDCPAYCYFQTREPTNLNFILHAPFLLDPSRQGIKAGEQHNKDLVKQLAVLAADSLSILASDGLVNDDILDIVPYDPRPFNAAPESSKLSFRPFFVEIKSAFKSKPLLPAGGGKCVAKEVAIWAADEGVARLFTNEQLALLTRVTEAHWVFRTRGKSVGHFSGYELNAYIGEITRESKALQDLVKLIDASFIQGQDFAWLHRFYSLLDNRKIPQEWKQLPLFLDAEGRAVPAFSSKGVPVLFLPDPTIAGYTTVHDCLLSEPNTRAFIHNIGITAPNLRAEVLTKLLPSYSQSGSKRAFEEFKTFEDFKTLFRYFSSCTNDELSSFVNQARDVSFLACTSKSQLKPFLSSPAKAYLPSADLIEWFESSPTIHFVCLDRYRQLVPSEEWSKLDEFLRQLGIESRPRVHPMTTRVCPEHVQKGKSGSDHTYEDKSLDGCVNVLAVIDPHKSLLLWNTLKALSDVSDLQGLHKWKNNRWYTEGFVSTEERRLRETPWLVSASGAFATAKNLTLDELPSIYDTTSPGAKRLIAFLGIRERAVVTSHLNPEEARLIKIAKEVEDAGMTPEDLRAAIDAHKRKKASQPGVSVGAPALPTQAPTAPESIVMADIRQRLSAHATTGRTQTQNPTSHFDAPKADAVPQDDDGDDDTDDFAPKPVNYARRIDEKKTKQASEIRAIELQQTLSDTASRSPKYSYNWVLALWELECLESNSTDQKTLSIGFGKVTRDYSAARTLKLSQPSGYIPQAIEEMSGVPVVLTFADGTTSKLRIEAFTAKEFELYGKLASVDDLNDLARRGLTLESVVDARIDVKSPAFLHEALLDGLRSLRRPDDFCMKAELPKNIEFVFGPPGTGKTTHLAEKVLIPRMRAGSGGKVLVLTPTNKAADVLTNRIIEKLAGETSYKDWLVRFGNCADERVEQAGVVRLRDFDAGSLPQSVTVTTIARFAYDGFTHNGGKKLADMKWDVIVLDEASMISLASVLYPLYKQSPEKFIIAGDPFQIEPIVTNKLWKDENIYTMVGLARDGSFKQPKPEPHSFTVTTLTTQYRSVPAIGQLFSSFTYDGVLKHSRAASSAKPLTLPGLEAKPLNLISFPVSKYESVYRAKKLKSGTSYQTYSALFTFELVRWMAPHVGANEGVARRIGVISPYRAQTNLLSKLLDSWHNRPVNIDVQVGTTHGFQGDECDIMIAVLNPPAYITNNRQMFLNKQNMLNVAISRARDYLFVLVPDNKTENIADLRKVQKLCSLIQTSKNDHTERSSSAIEQLLWNDEKYIEANTFSTGHQMVNVYQEAQRRYEVRSDDLAIDVQIHDMQRVREAK
jgi:hypothetical protein